MIQTTKKKLIKFKNFFLYRLTDYYFVSYPKCGRTWTRYFLANYLKKRYNRKFSLEFDNLIKFTNNYPRIIYTHAHQRRKDLKKTKEFADWLEENNKSVIFLMRDPRDVLVSSYFQYTKRAENSDIVDPDTSLEEFMRLPRPGIEKIVAYMNLWYKRSKDFDDFLLMSYEGLQDDSESEFSKFLKFLDIDLDQEILEWADEESSFEKMRQAEKSSKVKSHRLQPGNPDDKQSYKTRKGKVGGYKEYFSKKDIKFLNSVVQEMDPDIRY